MIFKMMGIPTTYQYNPILWVIVGSDLAQFTAAVVELHVNLYV